MSYSGATEFRSVLSGKHGLTPGGTYRESTIGSQSHTAGQTKEGVSNMTDDNGLDLGGATTAEGESSGSSSTSNRGGSSKRRQSVVVKGEYGTEFFDADTECEDHARNAEGVLVIPPESSLSSGNFHDTVVMCRPCREEFEDRYGVEVEDMDYRRFNR